MTCTSGPGRLGGRPAREVPLSPANPTQLAVYVDPRRMPKLSAWNEALAERGFTLRLRGWNPRQSPERANFLDDETGRSVDYAFDEVDEDDPHRLAVAPRTHVARFSPWEQPVDLVAAMTAAGVLAAITDGVVRGPDLPQGAPGAPSWEDLLDWARAAKQDESAVRAYLTRHQVKGPFFSDPAAGRAAKAQLRDLEDLLRGL